jgi:hypothetical protein
VLAQNAACVFPELKPITRSSLCVKRHDHSIAVGLRFEFVAWAMHPSGRRKTQRYPCICDPRFESARRRRKARTSRKLHSVSAGWSATLSCAGHKKAAPHREPPRTWGIASHVCCVRGWNGLELDRFLDRGNFWLRQPRLRPSAPAADGCERWCRGRARS